MITGHPELRRLGGSPLKVYPMALGTGTFGSRWGAGWDVSQNEAERIVGTAIDSGVNLVDTARTYNGGQSEQRLGRALAALRVRDKVRISTKFGFRWSARDDRTGGCHAYAVRRSVERSLQVLGVERIDLLHLHVWDGVTSVEETLGAVQQLQIEGAVGAYALSNVPGWYAAATVGAARAMGLPDPAAIQLNYNLLQRDIELEYAPLSRYSGISIVAWGPLANGLLTGKYDGCTSTEGSRVGTGRLTNGGMTTGTPSGSPRNQKRVLSTLRNIAAEHGSTAGRVALAWLLRREGVAAVVLGVTSTAQLLDNLAAMELELPDDAWRRLDKANPTSPRYPYTFSEPAFHSLIHGAEESSNE